MARIFISYSSEDSKFVDELVQKLQLRSIDVWYAKNEIKVGDSIVEKISDGIDASDWLLIVLSNASVKSRWVRQELNAAVALTVKRGAYILPTLIDNVDVPALLVDRKYANFAQDPEQAFNDVLAVVAPGMAYYNDETSQIAWGILSNIFKTQMADVDANFARSDKVVSEIKSSFSTFKTKWDMTDAVYDLYVDSCLDARRLLTLPEFIKGIPKALEKDVAAKDDAVAFLLKKLEIGL
jgi:hypothetical protein